MKTEQDYREFAKLAVAAEKALATPGAAPWSVYLFDENVDAENCIHHERGSIEFWDAMFYASNMAVGMRANEAGLLDQVYKLIPGLIY